METNPPSPTAAPPTLTLKDCLEQIQRELTVQRKRTQRATRLTVLRYSATVV